MRASPAASMIGPDTRPMVMTVLVMVLTTPMLLERACGSDEDLATALVGKS